MASITIRNIEERTKRRLRVRAAEHGRSMEEEARQILQAALSERAPAPTNLYDAIRQLVEPIGGVELKLPKRKPLREPPDFT